MNMTAIISLWNQTLFDNIILKLHYQFIRKFQSIRWIENQLFKNFNLKFNFGKSFLLFNLFQDFFQSISSFSIVQNQIVSSNKYFTWKFIFALCCYSVNQINFQSDQQFVMWTHFSIVLFYLNLKLIVFLK